MNISIFASNFIKMVKRVLTLLILLLCCSATQGQIHEVGLYLGGSNFVGDVGKENYISPNSVAFGGIYKWNRSTRHSWRFSVITSKLDIDDANASSDSRVARGLALENRVTEIAAGLEFNFADFNLHELGFKFTPYVHTGVGYFWYKKAYFINKQPQFEDKRGSSLAIPITVGIKFNITEDFILGLESGARYTFADDIDGSNPQNDKYQHLKFGNINSKDWYVFTGFTLTYTFGDNPCYCPL